jgi:transcriptional regulator with XRE-family HTH domain
MSNTTSNSPNSKRPRQEAPESKLRTARLAKGLAQVDLATQAAVSLSWISVLERKPQLMTTRVAERLASALGVPVEAITP